MCTTITVYLSILLVITIFECSKGQIVNGYSRSFVNDLRRQSVYGIRGPFVDDSNDGLNTADRVILLEDDDDEFYDGFFGVDALGGLLGLFIAAALLQVLFGGRFGQQPQQVLLLQANGEVAVAATVAITTTPASTTSTTTTITTATTTPAPAPAPAPVPAPTPTT